MDATRPGSRRRAALLLALPLMLVLLGVLLLTWYEGREDMADLELDPHAARRRAPFAHAGERSVPPTDVDPGRGDVVHLDGTGAAPTDGRPAKAREDAAARERRDEGVLHLIVKLPNDLEEPQRPIIVRVHDEAGKKVVSVVHTGYARKYETRSGLRVAMEKGRAVRTITLRGLAPAGYAALARTTGVRSDKRYSRVVVTQVGRDPVSVEIRLPRLADQSGLDVVVARGGYSVRDCSVTVRAGSLQVITHRIGFAPPKGTRLPVPADAELEVRVVGYEGRIERGGDVPPKNARIGAGQRATVRFDLPVGTPVEIKPTRASGGKAPVLVDLWRLHDRKDPEWIDADQAKLRKGGTGFLAPGRYHALVTPRMGYEQGIPRTVRFDVPAHGGVEVDVVFQEADRELTLLLRDAQGRRLASRSRFRLWRNTEKLEDFRCCVGPAHWSAYQLPALPPGTYDLVVWGYGHQKIQIHDTHLQAVEVFFPDRAGGEGTADLRGRIERDSDETLVRNCILLLQRRGDRGAYVASTTWSGAIYDRRRLPAGTYTLRIASSWHHSPRHAPFSKTVEILEGRGKTLDITLPPR